MPWDPLGRWPREQRWVWLTLAVWLSVFLGPRFVECLQAPVSLIPDFFQEYASARNLLEGLPVYSPHAETIPRYLNKLADPAKSLVMFNAHPPTSVLLALPFARLDFAEAFLAWNLVSLAALAVSVAIVIRALAIPVSAWSIAPLASLLLLCHPLWEALRLGQLTLFLLLLITGAWAAERSGRPRLAGALLAAATAIKLFPGFLLLYYAWRGRWKVVAAGAVALAAITMLTMAVLGLEAYRSYFRDVLPEIQWFRVGWNNASLAGFWSRLFDPAPERERLFSRSDAAWYSPALAQAGTWTTSALVVAILGWLSRRYQSAADDDKIFALATTAMLLVSPIAWDHYFLLLLVPLFVTWVGLPRTADVRGLFVVIGAALWISPALSWTVFDIAGHVASPIESLVLLSYPCYALLGLFVLLVLEISERNAAAQMGARNALAWGAIAMATGWVLIVDRCWHRQGLFSTLGLDFAIYRSIAEALVHEGPLAMYDIDRITEYIRPLAAFYRIEDGAPVVGPGPYPAVYILPFLPLTKLSPPAGFLVWTLINVTLAIMVARCLASRFKETSWALTLTAVLFFPIPYALFFGQLSILMLVGIYGAYRSFEGGHEFRAGLWCGMLLLKPQYAVFLALVLLFKRRWRALGGITVAGVVVLLSSLSIAGVDGLFALLAIVRSMASFRAPPDTIFFPEGMINWRGLLINSLPSDFSEEGALLLTASLSIITASTLALIWRGRWDPRGERFARQFLATLLVTLLASYHSHIHGGVLLLVPGMALTAASGGPRPLAPLVRTALYAPLPLFLIWGSSILVSLFFVVLMVITLAVLIVAELGLIAEAANERADVPATSRVNPADVTSKPTSLAVASPMTGSGLSSAPPKARPAD